MTTPANNIDLIQRFASIIINIAFQAILLSIFFNKDKPQMSGLPVKALLVLAMIASFIVWRWRKAGGNSLIVEAIFLGGAAYFSPLSSGFGVLSFLATSLYGLPFI